MVTPDLDHVSHVGGQPAHHYEWPRLVPVTDLQPPTGVDDHVLVRRSTIPWPQGYETADTIPGMREEELPDHPRHPVSGVQQFFMALLSPGLSGELGVAARMRERLPEGHTALREGASLVEWDEYHVRRAGEVVGLLARPDGTIVDVLVVHRHHLFDRRVARLPIAEVEHADIDQAHATDAGRAGAVRPRGRRGLTRAPLGSPPPGANATPGARRSPSSGSAGGAGMPSCAAPDLDEEDPCP